MPWPWTCPTCGLPLDAEVPPICLGHEEEHELTDHDFAFARPEPESDKGAS